MKKALITGVTGQDGSYLAELLLSKGYEVHGMVRRSSSFNRERIDHLHTYNGKSNFLLHYGDMTDAASLLHVIKEADPVEIYHLAAQSHVQISFENPILTTNIIALGALRLLETVKSLKMDSYIKIYNASTSELYGGKSLQCPQNEDTPFYPRSPYGISKLYAHNIMNNYRQAYGMFICNGILFNHESPRRGENFITRKITLTLAKILAKKQKVLELGNIDAKRDWGYAPDYVEAMWTMLQLEKPDDFVIATGETHTVREFCELAFKEADIDIEWMGEGLNEKGVSDTDLNPLITISPRYFRPIDVNLLCGDASKARETFGWKPKTTFEELVEMMVKADLKKEGMVKYDVNE